MTVARLYCAGSGDELVHCILASTAGVGVDHQPVDGEPGSALHKDTLQAMGGVCFAVRQLKQATAATTRRAWLRVVLDAACGSEVCPQACVCVVHLLICTATHGGLLAACGAGRAGCRPPCVLPRRAVLFDHPAPRPATNGVS